MLHALWEYSGFLSSSRDPPSSPSRPTDGGSVSNDRGEPAVSYK